LLVSRVQHLREKERVREREEKLREELSFDIFLIISVYYRCIFIAIRIGDMIPTTPTELRKRRIHH